MHYELLRRTLDDNIRAWPVLGLGSASMNTQNLENYNSQDDQNHEHDHNHDEFVLFDFSSEESDIFIGPLDISFGILDHICGVAELFDLFDQLSVYIISEIITVVDFVQSSGQ